MNKLSIKDYLRFEYPIEIRKIDEAEGGGYLACIPFLGKDAFIGDGESIAEAILNLDKTKQSLFEDYLKSGIDIPAPPRDEDYSGKFVLRLPIYLHQQLVEEADKNAVSLNQYCLALLADRNIQYRLNSQLNSICNTLGAMWNGLQVNYGLNLSDIKLLTGGPVRYFKDKDEVKYGNAS